jgi:hypothetical protein
VRRRRGESVSLLHGLQWYWDLDTNPASIVDQHSGLSLAKVGTVNASAAGGPDGGPCIDCGTEAGKYRTADVAKPFPYESGFTLNIWVYNTAFSSAGNWYINHRDTLTTDTRHFQMTRSNSLAAVGTNIWDASGTSRRANSPSDLSLDRWYMVTSVDYGTYCETWLDGVKVAENRTALGAHNTGTAAFGIGGIAWENIMGATTDHRGLLAMAGQWNRPLNGRELWALYNSGRGRRYATLNREEPSIGARRVFYLPTGWKPWLRTRQRHRRGER